MATDQLRFFLIIGLALTGFLIYQAWQSDYAPKLPVAASAPTSDAFPTVPTTNRTDADAVDDLPPDITSGAAPTQINYPPPDIADRIRVITDVYDIWIDPVGAGLVQAELLAYPIASDQPDTPIRLLKEYGTDVFLMQSGLLPANAAAAPNHKTPFTTAQSEYVLLEGVDFMDVPFTWYSEDGIMVTKTYRFTRGSYRIGLNTYIRNDSTQPWIGRFYGQFRRSEPPSEGGLFTTYTYTGGVVSSPDQPYKKIDFDDMLGQNLSLSVRGGWVAMIQHYFAGAWVPSADETNHYYSKALSNARFVLGVLTQQREIAPLTSGEFDIALYIGPKIQSLLSATAPNLERTVDYGFLWLIAEPLFWLLDHINNIVGNWGWSIILLTLLLKLVFFHLSATSYKSMARMRKLQPRIVALRERYLNDKTRMNQATMQLYKTEKVNPLAGCLPILVQIPVFIALYWMLLESVELRQAAFIFWYDDLSVHDPYFVLPVLMGVSMLVQQRLNPAPPDPLQAKVMMTLPFIFTFFFLFFPAGLVLYWLMNNLLSIAQQWVITKKIVGKI